MATTDKKVKLGNSVAHAITMPVATTAQLSSGDSAFNYSGYATKRFGVCVIQQHVDSTFSIVMALGSSPMDKWVNITRDVADITPSKFTVPVSTQYSDVKPKIKVPMLGMFEFPVLTKDEISSGDSVINQYELSGKRIGSFIICKDADKYELMCAKNYVPTGPWYGHKGTTVTPSQPTAVNGPFDKKPHLKNSIVTSVPFPVFKSSDLTKAAHPVNAGDGVNNGKVVRSLVANATMAIGDTVSNVGLVMAAGSSPTDKWLQFRNGALDLTPA